MNYRCHTFSPSKYLCTRPLGHKGRHMALTPDHGILSAWDDQGWEREPLRVMVQRDIHGRYRKAVQSFVLRLHENPAPDLSPPKDPPLKIVG